MQHRPRGLNLCGSFSPPGGFILRLLLAFLFFLTPLLPNAVPVNLGVSLEIETGAAIHRACSFLLEHQLPDGSWNRSAQTTSLALQALANSQADPDSDELRAAIGTAADFCAGLLNREFKSLPDAAWALQALARLKRPADKSLIISARQRLLELQFKRQNDSPFTGGFPETENAVPDLRTSQLVLETLYLTDAYERTDSASAQRLNRDYKDALQFIGRCQRRGIANSGSFAASPVAAADDLSDESVTLTVAGFTALIYGGIESADPAILNALDWLSLHLRFSERLRTPQPLQPLHVKAKLWRALERRNLAMPAAWQNWRQAFASKLLREQAGNGSWLIPERENHEQTTLNTAMAILILQLLR